MLEAARAGLSMDEDHDNSVVVLILTLAHVPVLLLILACGLVSGAKLHNPSSLVVALVVFVMAFSLHVYFGVWALRRASTLIAAISAFVMLLGYCIAGFVAFFAFISFDIHLY